MSIAFLGLGVDCADATALARFWAAVLGRKVAPGATGIGDVEKGSARWTTFTDIEGNEFDLIAG
jgi:hypothetical protein